MTRTNAREIAIHFAFELGFTKQSAEELLGEFLDISRMDLQSDPTEREPIQLSILLEQLADGFFPIFEEKSLGC
ncbi:MAG: hypothetical protein RRY64_09460, partial [Oscillospiraceae bacterium]